MQTCCKLVQQIDINGSTVTIVCANNALKIRGIYMTSFPFFANVRYNLDPLGPGRILPDSKDRNSTVRASIVAADVIRMTSASNLLYTWSIVTLTTSLRRHFVKYMPASLSNPLLFFVEKNVRIFCSRFSHIFNKKYQCICNIYV